MNINRLDILFGGWLTNESQTYIVSKPELDIIMKYVWDKGLRGPSNGRQIEELYSDCQLEPDAIGRRDKILVSSRLSTDAPPLAVIPANLSSAFV